MTDPSTRGRRNRSNGAANERTVAAALHSELGMTFKRNLAQTQEAGHGDLTASDDAFPFTIEVKRRKSGADCLSSWEVQAFTAAKNYGKHPVVIYKIGSQPWRCRVWFDAIGEAMGNRVVAGGCADLSIQNFAWIAREIMARRYIKS